MTASVSRLQASLSKVKDQSTSLDAELSSVKKDANTRRKDQEGQIRDLEDMKARDEAELRGLEAATGLRIEGIRGEPGRDPASSFPDLVAPQTLRPTDVSDAICRVHVTPEIYSVGSVRSGQGIRVDRRRL